MGRVHVGILLLASCATFIICEQNLWFTMQQEKKFEAGLLTTRTALSVRTCTMFCIATSNCVSFNWKEAEKQCELVGAYSDAVTAEGYKAYTSKRFCRTTTLGKEFTGTLSMTKTGRTCQRWDAQSPHSHVQTADVFEEDGGVFPDNYCRNIRTGDALGPWCYTTDPASRFEYCNLPMC